MEVTRTSLVMVKTAKWQRIFEEIIEDLNYQKLSWQEAGIQNTNFEKSSLKELVYKELTELETWLKVRSKETPCKQCINKDLCPSISNYELVIGKNNLCNIQHR